MSLRRLPAVLLLSSLACGPTNAAPPEPPEHAFPVPRAEQEFRELMAFPHGAAASGPVDVRTFLAIAGPYAPLDLQVRRARDSEEASLLKNMYLGVCGSALQVDAARLANDFGCGECTSARLAYSREHLAQFANVADTLRRTRNVVLVAQWWQPGDLRVNDMFRRGNWVREAIPSPELGFTPSGQWQEYATLDAYFAARAIDGPAVLTLAAELEKLGASAAALSPEGVVRIFLPGGIADNQAGLWFQDASREPPHLHAKTMDGFETVRIVPLSPGTYYFETT